MSHNRFKLDGLDELRRALRELPTDLRDEAAEIVSTKAQEAKTAIVDAYPQGETGNLKGGVTVERSLGGFSASATVKSRAPHAVIFEVGSQVRHTDSGANRGAMPPGHVFVPTMMRKRREVNNGLVELLKRNGLVVTGDAG